MIDKQIDKQKVDLSVKRSPGARQKTWRGETAARRVRRCLDFLRSSDLVTAAEHDRLFRRTKSWQDVRQRRNSKSKVSSKPTSVLSTTRDTIAERFRQFHHDNPHVFRFLVRLTREQYLRGRQRFGVKAMWEHLRWHVYLGTVTVKGEYKLNNNFTSRYVRLLVEEHPAYRGLFERRRLRAP